MAFVGVLPAASCCTHVTHATVQHRCPNKGCVLEFRVTGPYCNTRIHDLRKHTRSIPGLFSKYACYGKVYFRKTRGMGWYIFGIRVVCVVCVPGMCYVCVCVSGTCHQHDCKAPCMTTSLSIYTALMISSSYVLPSPFFSVPPITGDHSE